MCSCGLVVVENVSYHEGWRQQLLAEHFLGMRVGNQNSKGIIILLVIFNQSWYVKLLSQWVYNKKYNPNVQIHLLRYLGIPADDKQHVLFFHVPDWNLRMLKRKWRHTFSFLVCSFGTCSCLSNIFRVQNPLQERIKVKLEIMISIYINNINSFRCSQPRITTFFFFSEVISGN